MRTPFLLCLALACATAPPVITAKVPMLSDPRPAEYQGPYTADPGKPISSSSPPKASLVPPPVAEQMKMLEAEIVAVGTVSRMLDGTLDILLDKDSQETAADPEIKSILVELAAGLRPEVRVHVQQAKGILERIKALRDTPNAADLAHKALAVFVRPDVLFSKLRQAEKIYGLSAEPAAPPN